MCVWVIWWILDNKLWSKCKQLAPETGSIEREIQLFELWLSVASRGLLAFTFNFLQTLISIQLFLLKWECLTSWFRTDYLVCSSEPRIISQWLISTRNGGIFKGTGQSVCHISSTPTARCHQDACWHRFLQQSRTCKTWLHPNLGWTAAMLSTFQAPRKRMKLDSVLEPSWNLSRAQHLAAPNSDCAGGAAGVRRPKNGFNNSWSPSPQTSNTHISRSSTRCSVLSVLVHSERWGPRQDGNN